MTEGTAFVTPLPDPDSERYWAALREGIVLYQRCAACGHAQLYFRAVCKRCWSRELEDTPASGRGTVYSFTVMHQTSDPALAAETPFVLALVDLEEGPRVLGRVEADPDAVTVGASVSATFRDIGEATLLYFALAPQAS